MPRCELGILTSYKTSTCNLKRSNVNRADLFLFSFLILSKPAASSALFITCEWSNRFPSLILLLKCWQATFQQQIGFGSTAAGTASFVRTSSRHHKDIVSDVTTQEFLPELESATSGQDNPFDLWIAFCSAPKVTANVVCHITLQFVQSSHKDLQLPKDQQELQKCPLCLLSPVCPLQHRANKPATLQSLVWHPEQTNCKNVLSWDHIMPLY